MDDPLSYILPHTPTDSLLQLNIEATEQQQKQHSSAILTEGFRTQLLGLISVTIASSQILGNSSIILPSDSM
jgi:hypothetical protein